MKRQTVVQSPLSITLLDDDSDFSQLMAQWIAEIGGFKPLKVYDSGERLLRGLRQNALQVALIDIKLPGGSGLDWARDLKQRLPDVKIIFVTAFPEEATLEVALHLAGSSYLIKPFSRAELNQALQTVTSGGVYLSPEVKDFFPISAGVESGSAVGAPRQTPASRKSASPQEASEPLTPAELRVLFFAAQGMSYKQIADELGIHIKTVDNELARVRAKTGAHTCTEALFKLRWIKGEGNSGK